MTRTGARPAATRLAAAIGAGCFTLLTLTPHASGQCAPSWDRDFVSPGVNAGGTVRAFVEFDDGSGKALYAAGFFFTIDGQAAASFARWDGQSWTPKAMGFIDSEIRSLAVFDDGSGPAIYAGGVFSIIGGVNASQIARYDHVNDTWVPVGGGLNMSGGPEALAVYDGGLYAVGSNPLTARQQVDRWDGASWTDVSPANTLGSGTAAVVFDDGGGEALFTGGAAGVRKWDGANWTSVGSGLPSVLSLAAFNGELYAGTFCASGSDIGQCVHRWDGATWSSATGATPFIITRPAPGPAVRALYVADDGTGPALFAGGQMVNNAPLATNLARWDGTNWSPMTFGVFTISGGQILGVVQTIYGYHDGSGPGVYVGGNFNNAQNNDGLGGIASRGLARWGCFDGVSADPGASDLLASASVISSFGGQAIITVVPRDAGGNLLPAGRNVVISTTAGTLLGSVADLGDGTYRQELEASPGPAGAVVTATVDGVPLNASVSIDFVPVDRVLSAIVVDPTQIFTGESATVTVTPTDDNGSPAGPGFDVLISTTHGTLVGTVSDNGDGTYSQDIIAADAGTASITATVNGLLIDNSASLSVLDISAFGDIVSLDAHGNIALYPSIQEAINAADTASWTIFIAPGVYEETVLIDGRAGLQLVGLSGAEPAVLRGVVLSGSENITISNLHIDASGGPNDAVHLRGGPKSSSGVTLIGCTVTGAMKNGVAVDRDNEEVRIENCDIVANGRSGIDGQLSGGLYTIIGCNLSGNGYNGIALGRDVEALLIGNTITNNGLASGSGGGRYGIDRDRKPQSGTPEQVTLIGNVIEDNNGKPKSGQSDENINNYDQIIDATDDQPPYTD